MRHAIVAGLIGLSCAVEAAAQTGQLQHAPADPVAGARIEVTYLPSPDLAGESELRLRGRLRTADMHPLGYNAPHTTLGVLHRDGAHFRGSFVLPDSVVYVRLGVESNDGQRIDFGAGSAYEILVHYGAVPLSSAYRQQIRDFSGIDEHLARLSARQWTADHPDEVEAWSVRFVMERQVLTADDARALAADYAVRLAELADGWRGGAPAADDVGHLLFALQGVGDAERLQEWGEWQERHNPAHSSSVNRRVGRAMTEHRSEPERLGRALQEIARSGGTLQLWATGVNNADAAGDGEAMARWAERWSEWNPAARANLAARLLRFDALRAAAITTIEAELARPAAGDEARPLHMTRSEHAYSLAEGRSRLLTSLGTGQLAAGDTATALATLSAAAEQVWTPALLQTLADVALASGNPAIAALALAGLATDPLASAARVDSVHARLPAVGGGSVEALLEEGRARWVRQALASGTTLQIPDDATVLLPTGEAARLNDLVAPGQLTMLAVWSRHCQISRFHMPGLSALAGRLADRGHAVLSITPEAPSDDLAAFAAEQKLAFPLFHDADRSVMARLQTPGTPTYLVLDGTGLVRFRGHDLPAVERFMEAISRAP